MKKKNYKLPALPKIPSVPRGTTGGPGIRSSGFSRLPGFNAAKPATIGFGRPSQVSTKGTQSSGQLSNLLTKTTSGGGLTGALTSAAGFGGAISSLISGFEGLFGGGKSTPPPLVDYQLPTSQQQLITIANAPSVSASHQGSQSPAPFENQSAQIVQAVRQALLNSSALNDVIAEI